MDYCDIYHSADRYASSTGHFPIVLPRTIGWSFVRQRLILGQESLRLQGHSVEPHVAKKYTENQLQDLAGNASFVCKLQTRKYWRGVYVELAFYDSNSE